jgi:biopolymer transport protein ExbD
MSSYDNDDIEFDFFDEPETEEATQRRRLPRLERPRGNGGDGPPRPPIRMAPGLTPLLRLVLLVLLMIFIVVVLVFWAQSCQGASKQASYQHYMDRVRAIAQTSQQIGTELQQKLTTPGITEKQLEAAVSDYAQQQQQEVVQARSVHPPGPLRLEHEHLIEALELRQTGLSRLADALRRTAASKDSSAAGALLAQQAQLLVASDVDWDFFFKDPTTAGLKAQSVTGVAVPDSNFLPNPDLASTQSMISVWQRLHGASTGGTPSGKHGDALVSVVALPQSITLSTTQPTTIRASTDLAFQVTVENSGCCQEVGVPVTLTIQASPNPIVKRQTIDVIAPAARKTVVFKDIGQPPFGAKTDLKVVVGAVPGESNTGNNSATYPVFFSIG